MVSKSEKKTITDICLRSCFLLYKKLLKVIFAQDRVPSHRFRLVQDFIQTKLKRRFSRTEEWPISSPDVNPLDYFYWDFLKTKVYERGSGKPFKSEVELKEKIKSVWNICANDLVPIT